MTEDAAIAIVIINNWNKVREKLLPVTVITHDHTEVGQHLCKLNDFIASKWKNNMSVFVYDVFFLTFNRGWRAIQYQY